MGSAGSVDEVAGKGNNPEKQTGSRPCRGVHAPPVASKLPVEMPAIQAHPDHRSQPQTHNDHGPVHGCISPKHTPDLSSGSRRTGKPPGPEVVTRGAAVEQDTRTLEERIEALEVRARRARDIIAELCAHLRAVVPPEFASPPAVGPAGLPTPPGGTPRPPGG